MLYIVLYLLFTVKKYLRIQLYIYLYQILCFYEQTLHCILFKKPSKPLDVPSRNPFPMTDWYDSII
jgi:hypothetical protein